MRGEEGQVGVEVGGAGDRLTRDQGLVLDLDEEEARAWTGDEGLEGFLELAGSCDGGVRWMSSCKELRTTCPRSLTACWSD